MTSQAKSRQATHSKLYTVCGVIAFILAIQFLIAVPNAWFSLFRDNWLIKLFKLNAGFDGIGFDSMHGLNALDLVILVLVASIHLGLYSALRRTSRIWSAVAAVQPFLAIPLFMITQMQGRSAVMGSTLVISLVMLRSRIFRRGVAFLGIPASVLLLVGDFGTTGDSQSGIIAVLIGIGYVLLTAWFFAVGKRLLSLDGREHG